MTASLVHASPSPPMKTPQSLKLSYFWFPEIKKYDMIVPHAFLKETPTILPYLQK